MKRGPLQESIELNRDKVLSPTSIQQSGTTDLGKGDETVEGLMSEQKRYMLVNTHWDKLSEMTMPI